MHPLLRFTLDLFEPDPVPVSGRKAPKARPKPKPATPAQDPVVVAGAAVHFCHPHASREVRLGHALVAYEFKRGRRRSIGFSVGPHGLAVRAPKWVPLAEVDAALQEKSAWILRKLQESRERHARLAEHTIDCRDGAGLPFLGQTIRLKLDPEHGFTDAGAELVADAFVPDAAPATLPGTQPPMILRLSLPNHASPDQIRDVVQAWLMRQARQVFQERLDHFAPLLGVHWKKLALSNAGTRWGSARVDGSIRLNWRLIHFSLAVIDYVVAHELSHLREMNHSPRFWDTVQSVLPNYAALRQQLTRETAPRWN
ncbi:M48 family metallopeptidase [Rhodoferax sp.]|uniref:M48 family metallopeptidase n=1 Tax=Rhodoferax sp. TaxID=50421 RepID=UPI00261296B6|nr:SprT family zinc-dependent metalloprotease [Rhodoferax sp.]MDD3936567.1 SprT family zinc-dependent metalloprotease [Rhodoferax sp.]